ncbi:hypothetical protein HPP05_12165 [Corallococcus exiguus]|nr:hypothetical protein [Corallococcus exiguus]NPC70502.1 hypothetical protein [Corallococcus exiguus]NRD45254.1 hypothetical protein [Corallococcus exiguus]
MLFYYECQHCKRVSQNDESIVFGSKAKVQDGSHALYATEMPRSPEHK